MNAIIRYFLVIVVSMAVGSSCQQEETLISRKGHAAFSLSPIARSNGRLLETNTPAYVLLSIKDANDKPQENIKLPLFPFGQGYLSENLELETGRYHLTRFAVLSADNTVIYATPLEGSDLAKYVTDPLPIEFTIAENEGTQIVPEVLAVLEEDTPEAFGYVSFGFEVVNSKLKTLSNYYDPSIFTGGRPFEMFKFFYDDKGRLASYDRYVPDTLGNFRKQLHFAMNYSLENSDMFYTVTVWRVVNDGLDTIASRRKVYLDVNLNFVRDIIYDYSGQEVIRETSYSRFAGGFEVKERARYLMEDGQLSAEFTITRIVYDTDADRNITRQRIYSSHAEGGNVEERVEREYLFTHDSKANPLYKFHPYFTNVKDWGRYPDSQSKNNVTKITPVGCDEEYCAPSFTYQYQNGYVIEMSPGGFYGIYKRTFEYY